MGEKENVLRVSPDSDVMRVANSMSMALENGGSFVARAVGVGAVNQTAKAIAVSRGKVAQTGRDMVTRIGFQTVTGRSGEEISALVFRCTAQ